MIVSVGIGLAVLAAFHTGIRRNLHATFADGSWGRVQFGVGAAITSLYHGGYGYTISEVVREILTSAGLTGNPDALRSLGVAFPDNLGDPVLMENAFRKAIKFRWPFNPNVAVSGSGGEDVGVVDYVKLAFILFGPRPLSFYLTYFVLVGASLGAAIIAFRAEGGVLALFLMLSFALVGGLASTLLDRRIAGILDPRFLSTLGLIPAAHLAFATVIASRPSRAEVLLATFQSSLLIFAYWIRSSAIWMVVGLLVFAAVLVGHALWRREPRHAVRAWPIGVFAFLALAHLLHLAFALHPVYRTANERAHHGVWHVLLFTIGNDPQWEPTYGAAYEHAAADEMPEMAAKKYLERHPPADPGAVYLTADRRYVRIGVVEDYKRRAFLEFVASDPRFVRDAFLVHNVRRVREALLIYLSSLRRVPTAHALGAALASIVVALFLARHGHERRQFFGGLLAVTAGLAISLLMAVATAPGVATMGDQWFALIACLAGWAVMVLTYTLVLARRIATFRPRRRWIGDR